MEKRIKVVNILNHLKNPLQSNAYCDILNAENAQQILQMLKRNEIIQKHINEVSAIWKGKNGRWYTYLPKPNKEGGGRRLVAKRSEQQIIGAIIAYYEDDSKAYTIKSLYPIWQEYKSLHTSSSSYIHRINNDWIKYYLHDNIINKPISQLTKIDFDIWAHNVIKTYQLTKTQYYNMSIIIRQLLDFAKEKGIITNNLFREVSIQKKLFHNSPKPASNSQVFLTSEQPCIENEAWMDYRESSNSACLAILLDFQVGIRLGELVALKWGDIESSNILHIQRMERKIHVMSADGTWKTGEYEICNHTKSEVGNRRIYLTTEALNILSIIKSNSTSCKDNDFIFLDQNGNRLHARAIDYRIRKYCKKIGISSKSMHKIRKTYISTLVDAGLNINTIRELVGHADERTTLKNYTFDRNPENLIHSQLEKALCH